jgi:DNA invertase Pin-like site-specific DNA recombinase
MVRDYIAANPGQLLAEFSETISGLKSERPQLQKALAWCRIFGSTLVIAKLDRLARSVDLIAGILESGLDFVALDAPHANKFTLHILAALAEYESKMMSERMKGVHAAARARGDARASRARRPPSRFPASARLASAKSRRERTEARALDLAPLVWAAIEEGKSLKVIADEFNRDGIAPPRATPWSKGSIERLARRTRAEFDRGDKIRAIERVGITQIRIRRQAAEVGPVLVELWRTGRSYTDMRDELARRGITAPWGKAWGKASLRRYLMRALDVPALRHAQRLPA